MHQRLVRAQGYPLGIPDMNIIDVEKNVLILGAGSRPALVRHYVSLGISMGTSEGIWMRGLCCAFYDLKTVHQTTRKSTILHHHI